VRKPDYDQTDRTQQLQKPPHYSMAPAALQMTPKPKWLPIKSASSLH